MTEMATRRSRRTLMGFCRSSAVLTRMCVPSKSIQTADVWGEPSLINVARWAKFGSSSSLRTPFDIETVMTTLPGAMVALYTASRLFLNPVFVTIITRWHTADGGGENAGRHAANRHPPQRTGPAPARPAPRHGRPSGAPSGHHRPAGRPRELGADGLRPPRSLQHLGAPRHLGQSSAQVPPAAGGRRS